MLPNLVIVVLYLAIVRERFGLAISSHVWIVRVHQLFVGVIDFLSDWCDIALRVTGNDLTLHLRTASCSSGPSASTGRDHPILLFDSHWLILSTPAQEQQQEEQQQQQQEKTDQTIHDREYTSGWPEIGGRERRDGVTVGVETAVAVAVGVTELDTGPDNVKVDPA